MVKVVKCLNAGCTEFILADDGKVIIQPLEKCDVKSVPKDYAKRLEEIGKSAKETIYVSKPMFKAKVGEELKLE